MPSKIKLLLIAWIACCVPAAALGGDPGPVDTLRAFYQRYLDLDHRPNAVQKAAVSPPKLPFSKRFNAEVEENARVRCKDSDGPCAWGDDMDEYLDTQEIDPLLRYANSGFEIKELDARTVQVRFNVYPSETDEKSKAFYTKLITYRMISEGGRWVVDDLAYRDGVWVRAQLAKETAKARAAADRSPPSPPSPAAAFAAQFEKIVPLCEELFLPNSMAQDPGFDIDANQRDLEKRIEVGSRPLRSRDGLAYLKKRLASEQDDVAQACIRRIVDLPAAPPNAQKR